MKTIECWRWRFRDPATGRVCRTMYALSAEADRITLLQHQREIRVQLGASEWPVTSIVVGQEQVSVKAHVGSGAKERLGHEG